MSYRFLPSSIIPKQLQFATNDVKIKKFSPPSDHQRGKRGSVEIFSYSSRRRLLELCRNSGHYINSQICLTYHFALPEDGKAVKKQLNSFLTGLRYQYPGIHYVWVLEFQKRGFPHFHLFTDRVHEDKQFQKWCARAWNKICGESEQHLKFQEHANNFMRWSMESGQYLVKQYLSKMDQKIVPEQYLSVGRFWGNSRNMIPVWKAVLKGLDVPELLFTQAVRIITKRREKFLKKYKIKINYRNRQKSYSLPNATNQLIQLLENKYYEIFEDGLWERIDPLQLPLHVRISMPRIYGPVWRLRSAL